MIIALTKGIRCEHLRHLYAKTPPSTMVELQKKVSKYIVIEEKLDREAIP